MTIKKTFTFLLFILSVTQAGARDDARIRMAVLPLENITRSSEYDALCKRVPEIIGLAGLFQKDHELIEWKGFPPPLDQGSLSSFAERYQIEKIYYGSLKTTESGVFVFIINEWDASKQEIALEFTETAEVASEIFQTADRVIKKVAERIGYPNLAFWGARPAERGRFGGDFPLSGWASLLSS